LQQKKGSGMQQRLFGQAKTAVSALGYGAMSFSDFYGATDDEKSFAILDRCLDLGITHIDTSNVYGLGKSEKRIGAYLAKQGKQAQDFFTIATKAGIASKPDGTRYFDNSLQHLESELDKSLQRLGVEQVELLYVHRRDAKVPIEEVAESLATLVKKGKTRQIGFSEIAPTSLEIAHEIHPVAAVQSEYSLATRSPEMGLVQKCAELGTTFVAFSPVGRSLLTDRPLSFDACTQLAFMQVNPRFQQDTYLRNINKTDGFRALAADMGIAASGLAIAWLLAQGDHIIPIPGTRSVAHLNELASGVDKVLSPSDMEAIETVLPIGWCHGDRYAHGQWKGPEKYC
jgi:aryl-alcohol dehydrogenase-like predicted oxidoreductase